jgi:hypothetical protein
MLFTRIPLRATNGFAPLETIFAVLVLMALGVSGYVVFHDMHASPKTAPPAATTSRSVTTPTNAYATLSPATVPSKTAECSQPISFASNGTSGPVQCSNGDLNTVEWNALSALEPTVMTLGYGATSAQVQAALCADANASDSDANTKNGSLVEGTVYQIAALYYGWNFSPSPAAVLSGGC